MSKSALVLEDFLPYRLAVLSYEASRALSRVYAARFSLSIPEWRIIANLGQLGPLYAGAVASASSLDKPAVTRAIKTLVSKGLVQREIGAQDRRQVRLALTPRGRKVCHDVAALALSWERELLGTLSSREMRALDGGLKKLARRIADMGR